MIIKPERKNENTIKKINGANYGLHVFFSAHLLYSSRVDQLVFLVVFAVVRAFGIKGISWI